MLNTDPDDRQFTETAMRELGQTTAVHFVRSVKEGIEYAGHHGEPAVILINDQGAMHLGYTVLGELKKTEPLKDIPVVLLGEISTPEYVRKCYAAGANSFITKPSSVAGTRAKIASFFTYWFETVEL